MGTWDNFDSMYKIGYRSNPTVNMVNDLLDKFKAKRDLEQQLKAKMGMAQWEMENITKPMEREKSNLAIEQEQAKSKAQLTSIQDLISSGGGGLPEGTTFSSGGWSIPIVPKRSAAQEKADVENKEIAGGVTNLIEDFRKAQVEGKEKTQWFGEEGPAGRIGGIYAGALGNIGKSPSVNTYNKGRLAFATKAAKAAGEVRPTDEDIKRFLGTLPDTTISDIENNMRIKNLQDDLSIKDMATIWKERIGKEVTNSSISNFNSEEEALVSGIKGEVSINGRRARID